MNLDGLPFASSSAGFFWAIGLTTASSALTLVGLRVLGMFR